MANNSALVVPWMLVAMWTFNCQINERMITILKEELKYAVALCIHPAFSL